MSTFGAVMADSFGCLGDTFGRSVIYRTPDTDDATLTAMVGEARWSVDDSAGGQRRNRIRSVTFAHSDLSTIHPLGQVIIDGDVWAVTAESSRVTESMTRLEVVYRGKAELTREGFRR